MAGGFSLAAKNVGLKYSPRSGTNSDFSDNYFFERGRTQQYHQVGNAVPPLLAKQFAEIVYDVFKRMEDSPL